LRDHYVRGAKKRESFYETHEDNASEWFDLMCGWYDAIRPSVGSVICNVQMLADNKRHIVKWLADRSGDLVDVAIWDKGHAAPQMQAGILSNSFEFLFVFGGNGSRSIPFSDFHGTEQNIVRISPKGKNEFAGVHRAVMPVELVEWVIKLCSTAKSFVDPFGGTGTTLIACEKTGRINRSMELDPKYCDVIVQRWQEFTGQTATLESNGKPFISLKKAA
jgi:DNA modification methylase